MFGMFIYSDFQYYGLLELIENLVREESEGKWTQVRHC